MRCAYRFPERSMRPKSASILLATISIALVSPLAVLAQAPCEARQTNSSKIASDGTDYVTRIVPVPNTVSPEAQKLLARKESDAARPETLEQRRAGTDKWQAGVGEAFRKLYPVNVSSDTIAGVP